jgi:hypothetical protein
MIERVLKQRVAAGRAGVNSYLASDYYLSDARTEAEKPGKAAPEGLNYLTVRVASARLIYDNLFNGSPERKPNYLSAADWSRRLLDADLRSNNDKAKASAAVNGYLERAKSVQAAGEKLFGADGSSREGMMLAYYVADAEVLVLQTTDGDVVKQRRSESERTSAAKRSYEKSWDLFRAGGRVWNEELFEWSSRWRECLENAATTPEARQSACAAHLSRMKDLRAQVASWHAARRVPAREDFASQYYVADAEIQLLAQRRK